MSPTEHVVLREELPGSMSLDDVRAYLDERHAGRRHSRIDQRRPCEGATGKQLSPARWDLTIHYGSDGATWL